MTDHPITFCIFSYNRGDFLRNCVESVKICLPQAEIIILDDNSTDAETRKYLSEAASFCRVVGPEKEGFIKHGGLYHNMNTALRLCAGKPLVCFLQDDTQVVRPVSNSELESMASLFEKNPRLGFLHPCFIRGVALRKQRVTPLEGPDPAYFYRQDTGQSAGIHYSDLVVFNPARLLEAGWQFRQSEPDNDRQARELFGMMAYIWLPFAMWLPEVPAYRGKQKTIGLKLAERKKQVGFYPFRIWSPEAVAQAQQKAGHALPVAEDWLECVPNNPSKPWTYNPLTGLRFYKQLNNVEVILRRLLRRLGWKG
ncbi:glycosyltransferase family 2 protein [Marinobacter halotolerans]|uniref:glycosyltransferase family 2 protein n=1 Tax=Marinobacter halotolerans TaxID=1569211 RepID=UPI00124626F1|nr:glycosyltransferase family A protein [Marinobacter halotolerans]